MSKEQKLQLLCDKFNEKYPVGTKGILLKGAITAPYPIDTEVTGKAYIMCGNVMAFFKGVTGCYDASRFRSAN